MTFNKRYAIEAKYVGDDPPWKGWQVIRIYVSAKARDDDLARLISNPSINWRYRVRLQR